MVVPHLLLKYRGVKMYRKVSEFIGGGAANIGGQDGGITRKEPGNGI